jgi:hypothetical protein
VDPEEPARITRVTVTIVLAKQARAVSGNECATIAPRGPTKLGISFRPLQAVALGLDPRAALDTLLKHPFQLLRVAAYWSRLEPQAGSFDPLELDRQVDAAERAGKQIIICVGAVKAFGYPEFFVPAHHLNAPLPEGQLVSRDTHPRLLDAALAQVTRVVDRYKQSTSVVAWQVEHEAVDPLGLEHSWRLATSFVEEEVQALRAADPSRPVVMNGFLAGSMPVRAHQWWRTRDQGDSFAVANQLADIVGIDHYPRQAVLGVRGWSLYLTSGAGRGGQRALGRVAAQAYVHDRRLMVTEGQAEPWETSTVPPNPAGRFPSSCTPDDLVNNYNSCMTWVRQAQMALDAYLFWGAEYWLLRQQTGDPRYLEAFQRILAEA